MLRQINTLGDHIMVSLKYHHLTYEDRCQIYALMKSGISQSEIAKQLGVNRSTIARELRRNKGKNECDYDYEQAEKQAVERRKKASSLPIKMKSKTLEIVKQKLCDEQWSPEQISGWMKINFKVSVSHEKIYQYVWEDKKRGGTLYKHLRHHGKKYNKRKGKNAGRGLIPNRVDIDQRPSIVEEKLRIGDWEIDTIIGKNHIGAIVSMVDRSSKYTKLVLVNNKNAETVTNAIQKALAPLSDVVHTLTADNGKEFAMHEKISAALEAKVYFAKPYHSWERGLNEHTNGLVRQYVPKKTRFDILSSEQVQQVEDLLNTRPRKALKFRTPLEAFKRARFCS
jgi:IS30 family transposase